MEKKSINIANIFEPVFGGLLLGLLGWLSYSVHENRGTLRKMEETFRQITTHNQNANSEFNKLTITTQNHLSEINRELESINDQNSQRIRDLEIKVSRLEGLLGSPMEKSK